MKTYKLNIIESKHRIGFVFNSMELLTNRLERMRERVESLNRKIRIEETDCDASLEMRIFVE